MALLSLKDFLVVLLSCCSSLHRHYSMWKVLCNNSSHICLTDIKDSSDRPGNVNVLVAVAVRPTENGNVP